MTFLLSALKYLEHDLEIDYLSDLCELWQNQSRFDHVLPGNHRLRFLWSSFLVQKPAVISSFLFSSHFIIFTLSSPAPSLVATQIRDHRVGPSFPRFNCNVHALHFHRDVSHRLTYAPGLLARRNTPHTLTLQPKRVEKSTSVTTYTTAGRQAAREFDSNSSRRFALDLGLRLLGLLLEL